MNKKKIALIAGASMLVLGVPSVVFAQASGPFADVPADHWAYQSVDTLQKAGVVIGYPDGTYGGKRAMTRYEFAVAIARLLPMLGSGAPNGNFATKDDLAAAKAELEQKIQSNSDAIAALQKLVDGFAPELAKLGQDVAAIRTRLDMMETRLAAVEEEQRRIKFNGALNMIAKGDSVTKGPGFQDKNGLKFIAGPEKKHILAASDVYNDFVLAIKGRVSDTATANVKLDFGNYLDSVNNTASPNNFAGGVSGFTVQPGGLSAAAQKTTVWDANLDMPVNLGPLGHSDLVVGRFGNQWTKYTLMQTDADVYTNLAQTDSGNIITDGGRVDFKLGPASVNAWGGKFTAIPFAQPYGAPGFGGPALPGSLIASAQASPFVQGAGARAVLGNFMNGVLGLSFEQFGLTPLSPAFPRTDPDRVGDQIGVLSVYGADFNGAFPLIGSKNGLTLDASYTVAPDAHDSRAVNDVNKGQRYTATDDQIGYSFGALSLKGGYQFVGPEFTAPGSWGKVGAWTNPNNVEGGVGSAKYVFSPKLAITGDVQAYKAAYGRMSGGAPVNNPLQTGDKLNHWQVGANYGLSSAYALDLGYEQVTYDLKNNNGTLIKAGKPTQSFVTIGIGHSFNQNASFKLLYQIIQYRDKGTGFITGGASTLDTDGNVAVGQFQVKF